MHFVFRLRYPAEIDRIPRLAHAKLFDTPMMTALVLPLRSSVTGRTAKHDRLLATLCHNIDALRALHAIRQHRGVIHLDLL